MPRCIIIAAMYEGEERGLLTPEDGDLLICADRGYERALRFGMKPDLLVADFDSMEPGSEGVETVRLPHLKDVTDTWACVEEGRKRGYREFLVGGGLGGRLDHTMANLQLAEDCAARGESLWLCDRCNRLTALQPGDWTLPRMPGRFLSLFALTDRVIGLNLTGTLWPLSDAVLTSRFPLGVSNEWTAPEAHLSFREGILAVFFSRDP